VNPGPDRSSGPGAVCQSPNRPATDDAWRPPARGGRVWSCAGSDGAGPGATAAGVTPRGTSFPPAARLQIYAPRAGRSSCPRTALRASPRMTAARPDTPVGGGGDPTTPRTPLTPGSAGPRAGRGAPPARAPGWP